MLFANNANTTLASSLTTGATSMSVTSASAFPSPTGVQYFYCTLADAATQTTIEIVKVTSVSGTTFAITRAQDGTSATAFAAGAVVSLRLVRASLNDFPKLDETNTFNADQAISGQLTSSAGLATTGTFTATAPSDGLVMDYATGFGRFSAFAGDGFQWYNAGIANTKLMQLSSSGVITTATWNGTTVGVAYGGTGLTTLTAGYIPYGNGTSAFSSSSSLQFNGSSFAVGGGVLTDTGNFLNSLGVQTAATYGNLNFRNSSGSLIQQIQYSDSDGSLTIGGGASTAYPIRFRGASTEWGRFDTSGNLLVGTTSVLSAVGNSSVPLINAGNSGKGFGFYNGTNTYVFGGALGYEGIWFPTGAALRVYNGSSVGVYLSSGNTSWTGTSDGTLKNVISQITEGLSAINGLKPKIYSWKSDTTNKPYPGLIAQDVQTVLPNIVETETNGKLGIRYTDLIPYLISAIQELDSKFDAYVASHP